jgi:hypothetical protein
MTKKTTATFSLDLERDRDLIAWLDQQEKGQQSAAIRRILRKHIAGDVTVGDVLEAVRSLENTLKAEGECDGR